MLYPSHFAGNRLNINRYLVIREMIKSPRSKRKRIVKKWWRKPGNIKTTPDMNSYILNGTITMHPAMYEKLQLEERLERSRKEMHPPSIQIERSDTFTREHYEEMLLKVAPPPVCLCTVEELSLSYY